MAHDDYEIHAVKYAHHPRRSPENFIGGDPHDTDMPLDYFVWVVRNAERTFVVDTGFGEDMARQRQRRLTRPVGEGLRALGIDAATVSDVVITHMHYDHAGNLDLFPTARLHIQDTEVQYVTGRCMCHDLMRHPYDVGHVTTLVRRVYDGHVCFHDGAEEIAPGIEVHHIGGHTRGIQCVRVRTRRGWVVLASDTSHFYAHMETGRAFPIVHNVELMLEGFGRLRKLATSPDHIIPGHDPLVLSRYPASAAGLEGWVARLDADPRR